MKNISIQKSFFVLAIISILLVSSLSFISLKSFNVSSENVRVLRSISVITQRHMAGDMMHDAMRGDVLGALLAQQENDSSAIENAEKELNNHYATFKKNIIENQKEKISDNILSHFQGALYALEGYNNAAEETIAAARQGSHDKKYFHVFEESFEIMEEKNELISNAISEWALVVEKEASIYAHQVKVISVILQVLVFLIVMIIPVYARIIMFKPLTILRKAMISLSNGNTETTTSFRKNKNEIGAMAQALYTLRQVSTKAFAQAQMVKAMPTAIMTVDLEDELKIDFVNKKSMEMLKKIEHTLPCKADDIIGQSIDIFHKHPEHQRRLLKDPGNLPHKANINVGDDIYELNITPIISDHGNYIAPMLTWSDITDQIRVADILEEQVGGTIKSLAVAAGKLQEAAQSMESTA